MNHLFLSFRFSSLQVVFHYIDWTSEQFNLFHKRCHPGRHLARDGGLLLQPDEHGEDQAGH